MIRALSFSGSGPATLDMGLLSRPIEALGTVSFAAEFLELVRSQVQISHLNVLDRSSGQNPRELFVASPNFNEQALSARELYRRSHWGKDPIGNADNAHQSLFLLNADEIADQSYADDCYFDIGVIQRASILIPSRSSILQLNLFRRNYDGPFREQELQNFMALAPCFEALLRRHRGTASSDWTADEIEFRLRNAASELSEREVNVCARIVYGLTSEGIGIDLGISRNTVMTHRRRAYAKLGICSQSDLFKLLH